MSGTSFGYSLSKVDNGKFKKNFDTIRWNSGKKPNVKMGKDKLPKGSLLTKYQRDANEVVHDVLKYDVKKMVKSGDIDIVPGMKFFGYNMRDVMNDKV